MPFDDSLYINDIKNSNRSPKGDYLQGSDNWVFHSDCTDIPSDKGRTITGDDGEAILYQSVVSLPEDCPSISHGTQVRVLSLDGEEILNGTAKRFKRYQKNCKLWV